MKFFKCDFCEVQMYGHNPYATIKGYKPTKRGGILLPEEFHEHDFCSHQCIVKWMTEALEKYE